MIKIYSKENCSRCEKIKEYIKNTNLDCEIVDVTNNLELLSFLREQNQGAGFPVVKFPDGEYLAGQTEPIIEKLSKLTNKEDPNNKIKYDWAF